MYNTKTQYQIRVIPKDEKMTILGKFGEYQCYLYFTKDGSLVISKHQITNDNETVIYRSTKYHVIVKSEEKYESIGQLMTYCFNIGVKRVFLISRNPFQDFTVFNNKSDIEAKYFQIK